MAKIGKMNGPSDELQPGERLDLLQADVVPGSKPESANVATTAAVLNEASTEEQRHAAAGAGDGSVHAAAIEVLENQPEDQRPDFLDEEKAAEDTDGAKPAEDDDEDDKVQERQQENAELLDGDDPDEDEDDEDDLPPADEVPSSGPSVVTTAQYDPSTHTVAEVNAYLDGLDRDGEEYARVLDAESGPNGKGRVGVLDGRI